MRFLSKSLPYLRSILGFARQAASGKSLDGWPLVALGNAPEHWAAADEFRDAIVEGLRSKRRRETALRCSIDSGGSVAMRFRRLPPPIDEERRKFVESFCGRDRYAWPAEQLVFLDRPCYLAVESGVLLVEDGSIVAETVYPSTGEATIERQLGGGLNANSLSTALRLAPSLDGGLWAPLLGRWSQVYFHAVTESLVSDSALALAGLSPLVSYPVPAKPYRDSRQLATTEASSRAVRYDAPVVKLPRVVFTTNLYKHAAFGLPFRRFVERARSKAMAGEDGRGRPMPRKIYVARTDAAARPMTNEGELIAKLEKSGFHIFVGQGQTFDQQIRAFHDASLVTGPHGSGLTNLAFAAPDATLFELRPLNTPGASPLYDSAYQRISAVMGFSYCTHVSVNDRESETWRADIPEILDLVEAMT